MMIKRNVKQYREGYGFTQADLAIILGVTEKTIQRAEKDGEIDSRSAHKMSLIENYLEHGIEAVSKLKKYDKEKVKFLLNGNYYEDVVNKKFLNNHIRNSGTAFSGGAIFNYKNVMEIIASFASKKYGFGAKRISKLLYTLDKNALNSYGEAATGLTYVKMKNGPVPWEIYNILDDMVELGILEDKTSDDYESTMYYIKNENIKNEKYKKQIDLIKKIDTDTLVESSHNDNCWLEAQLNQELVIGN